MAAVHGDVEVLADGYELAEAPRADGRGAVYFTDVLGGGVYRWDASGVDVVLAKRRGVGGLALHRDGGVVVSGRDILHLPAHGDQRVLWGAPEGVTGFNDVCARADGTLLAGALRFRPFAGEAPVPGTFFAVTGPGVASPLAEDVEWPNGCGVSPDGATVYLCDYSRGEVRAVTDAGPAGADGGGAAAATAAATVWAVGLDGNEADGLAVDEEGGVWVAQPRAGRLVRLTPDGVPERTVDLAGWFVTSVAFDGDAMYLTTGRSPDRPGALLRMPAPVRGIRHHLATL